MWSTHMCTPPIASITRLKPLKSMIAAPLKESPVSRLRVSATSSAPPARPAPFREPKKNASVIFDSPPR